MDFEFSDEQEMLRDSIMRHLDREYAFERRRASAEAGPSEARWAYFAEMGWLAAGLPEELGGLGGGPLDMALIAEQFGRRLVIEPYLAVAVLAAQTLLASKDPRAPTLLSGIADGSARPVLAHNEAAAGGDLAWVETRAEAGSDGGWRLNGRKTAIWGAPFADSFLISARTSGEPGSRRGLSLFRVPASSQGVEMTAVRLADSSRAGEVVLADARLPADALWGALDEAFDVVDEAHAVAIAALCADAVGAMEAALWITRDYLKVRVQFGQPIGSFQALQHRMADMLIEVELSRSMTHRALAYLQAAPAIRRHAVSAAKVQIGKSAKLVGGQAIQLHGAIGITEEYVIGHYFKRLTVIDNAFGSVAAHLEEMARSRAPDDIRQAVPAG